LSDNTTINPGVGGDTLATEEITADKLRTDPALPAPPYKIARGKIALGSVDEDSGDVSEINPLPVVDGYQRRANERAEIQATSMIGVTLQTRQQERVRHGDRWELNDERSAGGR
jgi:hypothetical protein